MLIAIKHLGSVGVGVTDPQFFRANDEQLYVVKLQDNRLGTKVLINEFVGAQLGKLMNLSFPTSDIIEINEQLLQENHCLIRPTPNLKRHFASRYLTHTEYVGKHNLSQGINTAEMAGVMLFDHMFHNADRANNRRNLLLRQEATGYKLYAIDNSHLFRSGKWTVASLAHLNNKIKPYYRYTFGMLLKDFLSPQDFIPYLEKVTTITPKDIASIVEAIPFEWLADPLEKQALIQQIKIGCDKAVEIHHTLCKYIPKTRGGDRWLYARTIRPRHKRSPTKL